MKLIAIILTFLIADCYGQSAKKWTVDSDMKNEFSIHSTGNRNLFDTLEMKQRKFRSVCLVKTSGDIDIDGKAAYQDTLIIYHFNGSGSPVEEIHIQHDLFSDTLYKKTLIYDLNKPILKKDSTITQTVLSANGDSTVTVCIFWDFESVYDTAIVYKTVYDKNKNISASERIPFKSCESGPYKKYICRYDEQNRLIYSEEFGHNDNTRRQPIKWESGTYQKISYPFYGKLIETYDSKTNELKDQEVVLINDVDGVITTTDRTMQVTTVPMEPGSKLIQFVTIVRMNMVPNIEHYEFRYR